MLKGKNLVEDMSITLATCMVAIYAVLERPTNFKQLQQCTSPPVFAFVLYFMFGW
jgi:hypothetical protein